MTDHADAWILAIDFGTSNTAAAIRSGARNDVLELSRGSRTMPSGVILDTGNGPRVGEKAQRLRALHQNTYEENPKNLVGMPPQMYGGRPIRAEEFVAEVYREVRRIALDRKAGVNPAKVVLTHPSAWGGVKTQPLRRAAESAGFDPRTIVLVEEPIAAAHYFRHESAGQPIPIGSQVLVFDFGGGTLDLALVEHTEDGEFEVKDIEAIENLGGNNLDEVLWDWTLAQIQARHPEAVDHLGSSNGYREEATLRENVRSAKEDLSFAPATEIPVIIADYDDVYRPTAEEYETLIRPLVERAVALTKTLLDRNEPSKVVKFYLTGGSSLTPLVARALAQATGITPTRLGDPKTVVVDGALSAVATGPAQPHRPVRGLVNEPDEPPRPPTLVQPPSPNQPTDKTKEPPRPPTLVQPPSPNQPTDKTKEPPRPPTLVQPPSPNQPTDKTKEPPRPPTLVQPTPGKSTINLASVRWAFIAAGLLWLSGVCLFISLQLLANRSAHDVGGMITAFLLQACAMAALFAHHLTRPAGEARVAAFLYSGLAAISLVMAFGVNDFDASDGSVNTYAIAHMLFGACLVFIGFRLLTAWLSMGTYGQSLLAPAWWLIPCGAFYILSLISTYFRWFFVLQWVWPATIVGLGVGYTISAIKLKRELENDAEIVASNANTGTSQP
ncbi:Hsp70 family protein [Arthrobacter sp. W4I7]|uniref:Hsp70 family protein n=1 Tax=Arthrobacter sp. W4I7 TaxID=3042296 RepID=UPI0027869413|nr:Hsp70 family protein [Arthrobacter sp. W4I7]MDQ0693195.1 cell division ATPase FtsA [Arthrobacter sp. W4I7]